MCCVNLEEGEVMDQIHFPNCGGRMRNEGIDIRKDIRMEDSGKGECGSFAVPYDGQTKPQFCWFLNIKGNLLQFEND